MSKTASPRRADIASFYTCQHPEQFQIKWRAFYEAAEARTDALRSRVAHALDLDYGEHPKQRLDLYWPERVADAPVLLFLHGGGFREGDPTLYGFLAEPFVARGIVFGTVGYRLTPETYLPDTFEDVRAALAWTARTIASFGGSPDRVVLTGHSAGAILTAQAALSGAALRAAVPISGIYDFSGGAEFIRDHGRHRAASPLLNISTWPAHTLVAYGERENKPTYGDDSQRLVTELQGRGASAELMRLDGLDHAETVLALADEASPLFQRVAGLLNGD
ncbi:MAG TPA: alpha/beta hydrolase [Chloroflexota bacterium]